VKKKGAGRGKRGLRGNQAGGPSKREEKKKKTVMKKRRESGKTIGNYHRGEGKNKRVFKRGGRKGEKKRKGRLFFLPLTPQGVSVEA